MRNAISNPTLSSDQITWDGRTGTVDASDLGFRPGQLPGEIFITSSKTRNTVRFSFWNQEVRDGDLLSTNYVAVVGGLYTTVKVFND